MTRLSRLWRAFWFEPSRPTNLGIFRLIVYAVVLYVQSGRDFAAWAEVPDLFWRPIRMFGVFHLVVLSAETLRLLTLVWTVALVTSGIGLLTRWSTAVAFGLGLYLIGLPHNFGKVHHGDAITVLILGILAVSRCGDAWSIDRLVALARRAAPAAVVRPRESAEYTWPLQLVRTLMALVFLGAGTSKLRGSGLRWVVSDNMANMLVNHHYSHHPPVRWGLHLAQHRWATSLLAGLTITLETSAPLALLSRRLRVLLVPSLCVMQAGIWLFMGIRFPEFLLLYLVWVPWDRIGDALVARTMGGGPWAVLYDGSCTLCRRTVGVLQALDVFRRLQLHDVHADWDAVARRYPHLTQAACLQEMHVVSPVGRITTGFDGYRALARVIPAAWPVWPLLDVPGVPSLGRRVYAHVAARRACRIDGARVERARWSAPAVPPAVAAAPDEPVGPRS
jgi:predicted DCC family thiol-disulfide oxidoreductase YuxK